MSSDKRTEKKIDESTALTQQPAWATYRWKFTPLGCKDEIDLSVAIARGNFVKPTKRGFEPAIADCVRFCMMCKHFLLNPWTQDCCMIGYDSEKDGPSWVFQVQYHALLKRAEERRDEYSSLRYGVVVIDKSGELLDRRGEIVKPTEKLLGGWCEIKRKDREDPVYASVNLKAYSSSQRYKIDPEGMIAKTAIAKCCRLAFPQAFAGMYIVDEMVDQETRSEAAASTQALTHEISSGEKLKQELQDLQEQLRRQREARQEAQERAEPVPVQKAKPTDEVYQGPAEQALPSDENWVEDDAPSGDLFDRGSPAAD